MEEVSNTATGGLQPLYHEPANAIKPKTEPTAEDLIKLDSAELLLRRSQNNDYIDELTADLNTISGSFGKYINSGE